MSRPEPASMTCPFCLSENAANALVCGFCSRDIAVPESLIAERDDLIRKRDIVRHELMAAKREIEELRRRKKHRSI
jgi:hypothetical protein